MSVNCRYHVIASSLLWHKPYTDTLVQIRLVPVLIQNIQFHVIQFCKFCNLIGALCLRKNSVINRVTIFMTLLSIFIADVSHHRPTSVRFSWLLISTANRLQVISTAAAVL